MPTSRLSNFVVNSILKKKPVIKEVVNNIPKIIHGNSCLLSAILDCENLPLTN